MSTNEDRGRIESETAIDIDAMNAGITDENRPDENFDWPLVGRELL